MMHLIDRLLTLYKATNPAVVDVVSGNGQGATGLAGPQDVK
jgi:hypothetical protein